jgi:uncharacterized protein YeeX (DUF496 family)
MNNRIKITGNCCVHCGKTYKKKKNLDDHIMFCDLIHNSKKEEEEEVIIPSAKNMYKMLIELGKKYTLLEEKITEMTKGIDIKKKKINALDWLNENVKPKIVFENILSIIKINDVDAEFFLDNSFYDVLHGIFTRTLFCLEDKPIFASNNQKANTFYIYQVLENGNKEWILASREILAKFFNKIHIKFIDVFYTWKKVKILEVGLNKDKFETACDKAIVKLMSVDFRLENIFSKTKAVLLKSSTFEKVEPNF